MTTERSMVIKCTILLKLRILVILYEKVCKKKKKKGLFFLHFSVGIAVFQHKHTH